MKLNNKGFAITSVLYGLLILFVLLVGTYLTILSSKKNRVDNLLSDFDKNNSYTNIYTPTSTSITFPYKATYTGKYIFGTESNNELNCITYLYKDKEYNYKDIKFTNSSVCTSTAITEGTIYLKNIYYEGDTNE